MSDPNASSPDRNPRLIESLLLPLKAESLECLHRFMEYKRPIPKRPIPKKRTAAVAIMYVEHMFEHGIALSDAEGLRLFVGRMGDLYLLLSTRAGNMRSYASDTALPGGKYEDGDEDDEGTARREAYEEIGLPMDRETVRLLCLLEGFLSGNGLIVTPIVLLVTDNATNPILNPTEVTHLFSMPLPAFLYDRPSLIPGWYFGLSNRVSSDPAQKLPPPEIDYADGQGRVGGKEGRYYQYRDVYWGSGVVRMHRFLTGREGGGVKPVYGLTAAILIRAAIVGFAQTPTFEVVAPGQKSMEERMVWDVRYGAGPLRRAIEAEGLWEEWKPDTAKL